MVRRTRTVIEKYYKSDLKIQGLKFPKNRRSQTGLNIKIADLFAGIGGIRLGFERAASKN